MTSNEEPNEPKFMRPKHFAQRFGMSLPWVYALISNGQLRAAHFGKMLLIPVEAADALEAELRAPLDGPPDPSLAEWIADAHNESLK